MKANLAIVLFLISLSGCFNMFDKDERLLYKYKIDDKNTLEVSSIGYGATSKDFTEIKITTPAKTWLIKRVEGDFAVHKISITPVKKDVYKITFTDTAMFKGMSRSFEFSINDKQKLD